MRTTDRARSRRRLILVAALSVLAWSVHARAGSWQGIEPLKTRRDEVLKILGPPLSEGANGSLTFKVMGGTVSISFVDENFVKTKRLHHDVAGTVLQIILQHENSSDTPESMNLTKHRDFIRDETKEALIYRNLKEGIVYTFLGGKLRTTRYTFSESQIGRARH